MQAALSNAEGWFPTPRQWWTGHTHPAGGSGLRVVGGLVGLPAQAGGGAFRFITSPEFTPNLTHVTTSLAEQPFLFPPSFCLRFPAICINSERRDKKFLIFIYSRPINSVGGFSARYAYLGERALYFS